MGKENDCELWENGRKLADARGLQLPERCPYDQVCTGSDCTILNPPVVVPEQIEKFKARQKKTDIMCHESNKT